MSLKDIRPALRAFLLADAVLSTAVGAVRIYPVMLPQGQRLASVVYQLVSEINDHHSQGASGLVAVRMQIDAWATTQDAASALALLVKERLDGYRGIMGSGGAVVNVQGVFSQTARFDYDNAAELHRVSRDFLLHYEER